MTLRTTRQLWAVCCAGLLVTAPAWGQDPKPSDDQNLKTDANQGTAAPPDTKAPESAATPKGDDDKPAVAPGREQPQPVAPSGTAVDGPSKPPAPEPIPDQLGSNPPPPPSQPLVGGAPLSDPNVAVHVVEKKPFPDHGRFEIVLYPAIPQLNGEFTQHYGSAASFLWHAKENFALQLTPIYNWWAHNSGFNGELNSAVGEESDAASSLLLRYGATLGFEAAPLYGKFALMDGVLGRFQIIVSAGAGAASTEHELKPGNASGPATYGDTGFRFTGNVGAGFRLQLGEHFTLRFEVRDLLYTARVDTVNGCSATDLTSLIDQRSATGSVAGGSVGRSCHTSTFSGTNKAGYDRGNDLYTAQSLAMERSSAVLNDLGLYTGFGYVF